MTTLSRNSTPVKLISGTPFAWGLEDAAQGRPATFGYDYFWGRKLADYVAGHQEGQELMQRVQQRVLAEVRGTLQAPADFAAAVADYDANGLRYVKPGTVQAVYDEQGGGHHAIR